MENNKEQEELLTELLIVETMVKENPCGMPTSILNSLKNVLRNFIGEHCIEGASREQVAKYFGKDVRTVNRWKAEHDDFPSSRQAGKREAVYCWTDIVRWKLKHSELFK